LTRIVLRRFLAHRFVLSPKTLPVDTSEPPVQCGISAPAQSIGQLDRSCLIVVISIADNLVISPVAKVPVQGSVNQRHEQDKGANKVDDLHDGLLFFEKLRSGDWVPIVKPYGG
jgi:hypothetical protein